MSLNFFYLFSLQMCVLSLAAVAPDKHYHEVPYDEAYSSVNQHPHKPQKHYYEQPNLVGTIEDPTVPRPEDHQVAPIKRFVRDTEVICEKTHMTVKFNFSTGFDGYIYPYGKFNKCIFYDGSNAREATLVLKHGACADVTDLLTVDDRKFVNPIIEHRLMVQWERDFICDDDISVIVRCDRPDDFNKTVAWNFNTLQIASTLEYSQHPGPKMWMQIQQGEGPEAPPLTNSVFIGDVLTLVFTLTDNVFWFDSNVLACTAIDGSGDKTEIDWVVDPHKYSRPYSGEMRVIENSCTVKPKIFSHFYKEKQNQNNGQLTTLHYAYFKAFRFPTSEKVIIQCDVQVCYRNCDELPSCSSPINPHILKADYRSKRSLNSSRSRRSVKDPEEGFEMDNVNLHKSIVVHFPEDGSLREVNINSRNEPTASEFVSPNCDSNRAMFISLLVSSVCCVLLVLLAIIYLRMRKPGENKFYATPNK